MSRKSADDGLQPMGTWYFVHSTHSAWLRVLTLAWWFGCALRCVRLACAAKNTRSKEVNNNMWFPILYAGALPLIRIGMCGPTVLIGG